MGDHILLFFKFKIFGFFFIKNGELMLLYASYTKFGMVSAGNQKKFRYLPNLTPSQPVKSYKLPN